GSLSPQDIRDRILADEGFELQLLQWLDDCHSGNFLLSSAQQLAQRLEDEHIVRLPSGDPKVARRLKSSVRDPATMLPLRPPPDPHANEFPEWFERFCRDTDDVLFCSNRHDPEHGKGCWKGYCKARFPREAFPSTQVDRVSGALQFKKTEQWLNTFHPVLSHLLRCNSDVTCLLSGTQVKAVVAYVTDYITKSSLSTHSFFETVKTV
ncbi:hypothetical protein C8Q79DRAFT_883347, partial [Trametes meyenii]